MLAAAKVGNEELAQPLLENGAYHLRLPLIRFMDLSEAYKRLMGHIANIEAKMRDIGCDEGQQVFWRHAQGECYCCRVLQQYKNPESNLTIMPLPPLRSLWSQASKAGEEVKVIKGQKGGSVCDTCS